MLIFQMNAQDLNNPTKQFADRGAHAPSRARFGALAETSGERRLPACSSRQPAANILGRWHCVVRLAFAPAAPCVAVRLAAGQNRLAACAPQPANRFSQISS